MKANISNTLAHRRLVDLDFSSQYMTVCHTWSSYMRRLSEHHSVVLPVTYLQEGATFVAAYLLVLVIKVGRSTYAFLFCCYTDTIYYYYRMSSK